MYTAGLRRTAFFVLLAHTRAVSRARRSRGRRPHQSRGLRTFQGDGDLAQPERCARPAAHRVAGVRRRRAMGDGRTERLRRREGAPRIVGTVRASMVARTVVTRVDRAALLAAYGRAAGLERLQQRPDHRRTRAGAAARVVPRGSEEIQGGPAGVSREMERESCGARSCCSAHPRCLPRRTTRSSGVTPMPNWPTWRTRPRPPSKSPSRVWTSWNGRKIRPTSASSSAACPTR